MMKNGSLDVMLNIVKTPQRQKYLLYTPSYGDNPNAIISKKNTPYKTIESLFGKTIALPKGFFYEEVLKSKYPEINLLPL
jgi:ABC-type amino acid transport substrate-binding protein